MYNGSTRNTSTLKDYPIKAGERFYLRKIADIEAKISKMEAHIENTPKKDKDKVKLLQLQEKRDQLIKVDLSYVLKLQYL